MFVFFAVLAGMSGIITIAGAIWALVVAGKTTHRSGPDVGAEIMSGQLFDSMDDTGASRTGTVFVGKAAMIEREATFSFHELKADMQAGQWSNVAPVVCVLAGFLGLLFFGGLAVLGLVSVLVGGVLLAMGLYAAIRMLIDFIRA